MAGHPQAIVGSCEEEDLPMACGSVSGDGVGKGKDRIATDALMKRVEQGHGPNTLVALVGSSTGRWSPELASKSPKHPAVRALQHSVQQAGCDWYATKVIPQQVVGLAVLEGWRFVCDGRASSQDSFLLMSAAQEHHSRRGHPIFVEHNVLASAFVDVHTAAQLGHPHGALLVPGALPMFVPKDVAATLSHLSCGLSRGPCTPGHPTTPLKDVLGMWSKHFGVSPDTIVWWPLWSPLAIAIANGRWAADVSAIFTRASNVAASTTPVQPPRKQVQYFKRLLGDKPSLPQPPQVHTIATRPQPWARLRRFSWTRIVDSIRFTRTVCSQDEAFPTAKAAMQFWYPDDWEQRMVDRKAAGVKMPGRNVLARGRVSLDMAAMLLRRVWYQKHGPTYRYIGIDASPQRPGQEVLAAAERVILQEDLKNTLDTPYAVPVDIHHMPVCVLGHGRCGLAEKTQTLMHMCWLEYGPSLQQVRQSNLDVRQVLTDMGTEIAISETPDIVQQCVYGGSRLKDHHSAATATAAAASQPSMATQQQIVAWHPGHKSFLFPLALQVPGLMHLLDKVLKSGVEVLPWWPSWQTQAKVVSQWLGNKGHREFLQSRLRESDPATLALHKKSLQTGCDRFAAWRWQTLANVARDLDRMRDAVRAALASVSKPADLGTRDAPTASAVLQAIHDDVFWRRASGLRQVLAPVHKLSSWVKGCDCHEADLLLGKEIACRWKGCRATTLAARLSAFEEAALAIREERTKVVGISTHETAGCVTAMLAMLRLKFAWVNEAPYTIWQMDTPQKAAEFLRQHDAMIVVGDVPHRVTSHFVGQSSLLRADMESYIHGSAMSASLQAEVTSYQMCMLDDTWVEALHRDISGIGKRKGSSVMAYRFSTFRLKQNLVAVDGLSHQERALYFQDVLPMRKAILRPATFKQPKLGAKLIQVRHNFKIVAHEVYRLGATSLFNWSSTLSLVIRPVKAIENARLDRAHALQT